MNDKDYVSVNLRQEEELSELRHKAHVLGLCNSALRGKLAERDAEIKALREFVFDLSKKLRECSAPPPLN